MGNAYVAFASVYCDLLACFSVGESEVAVITVFGPVYCFYLSAGELVSFAAVEFNVHAVAVFTEINVCLKSKYIGKCKLLVV